MKINNNSIAKETFIWLSNVFIVFSASISITSCLIRLIRNSNAVSLSFRLGKAEIILLFSCIFFIIVFGFVGYFYLQTKKRFEKRYENMIAELSSAREKGSQSNSYSAERDVNKTKLQPEEDFDDAKHVSDDSEYYQLTRRFENSERF